MKTTLTYLPGIIIAAIGVAIEATNFKGFDTSEKHHPPTYAKDDVRGDENRVNEMGVIMHRLEGSSRERRDPFVVGMQAFGAISSITKGKDISEGIDSMKGVNPIDFVNSLSTDPKTKQFHLDLSKALNESKSDYNQIDLLNR